MAVHTLRSSAIRDLLAVTERPDVISLAGGLPAAELLPHEAIAAAAEIELRDPGALQYSTTQGYAPLREWIAAESAATDDEVIITHGSQQALDLVARTLVRPGETVVLADPAYVGAIQAFSAAGADLVGVPSDADGLRTEVLAELLRLGCRPSLVYVVPDFDNPSGSTLCAERRIQLAELAERYGFWTVADEAYRSVRWAGDVGAPIPGAIRLGSFSKVLSPGLRVGWATGPADVISSLVLLKQAADLHTSTLAQRIVWRVVTSPGFMRDHLARLRREYQVRAQALTSSLELELGHALCTDAPRGGMFLWASLAAGLDGRTLLGAALDAGVAFVPGDAFAVGDDAHADRIRLSFASVAPDQAHEAACRLARAVADCASRRPA